MRKKAIIAGAVLIAILLCITILFIVARQSSPTITVRHVKSVQSGHQFTETFEITNHTSRRYYVYAFSVQVSNGLIWKDCYDSFGKSPSPPPILGSRGSETADFDMTNFPKGFPLRLRMKISKELAGLEKLFQRLDLRFRLGQSSVSLNPFEKHIFFGKYTEIVSDEFVEPEQKGEDKGGSEK